MAPTTSSNAVVTPGYRIGIQIDQTGQNQGKNTSDVRVRGFLYNDSSAYIWNAADQVDRQITGLQTYHPSPFGFNMAPHSTFTFIDHTFTCKHSDTDGTLAVDFTVQYGDTGTPGFGSGFSLGDHLQLTRIPQEPAAPPPPTFTNITMRGVTVSWGPSPDNHGAKITDYDLRRWNADHTHPVISTANNLTRNVTGLSPGDTYIFEVRARNSVGNSPWSDERLVDLNGGGRVRINGMWRNASSYVRAPGKKGWVEAIPYVRIGGVWKKAR